MSNLDIVTPAGAARMARVSRAAISKHCGEGKIKGIYADDGAGADVLVAIRRAEVQRYIQARGVDPLGRVKKGSLKGAA